MSERDREEQDYVEPNPLRPTADAESEGDVESSELTVILPEDADLDMEFARPSGDDHPAAPELTDAEVTEDVTEDIGLTQDLGGNEVEPEFETPREPSETDEVFVLLPEMEGDQNIPVVDTEEVTVEDESGDLTERDVSLQETDPLTDTVVGVTLDDLTSDMDDELLTDHGEAGDEEGDFDDAAFDSDEFAPAPEESSSKKWIVLAATALVGLGLFYFFVFPNLAPEGDRVDSSGGGATIVDGGGNPVDADPVDSARPVEPTDPADVGPLDPVDAVAGVVDPEGAIDPAQGDPTAADRKAFQDKFLVSIQLGFLGEVGDE